ncbi:MAG: multifunctional CCA tRNA nucleotidyl transferase/2'3'-cyclic phosphodiesterase/2'nucleotidase/phosphatase [Endozoicomonadaceae bacterium]|nr:multifunctional CCA tRNA nucleotidyl transferase/2'3'-cyclic phosphodiesterase/2'nucleotidase/phosphatase [Endozoicomonadaceae bacterium]
MKIYLVGGAIRDELLNLDVVERDWVVVGSTPDMMIEKGFKLVGGHFPVFLHPMTHEEYALARTEKKQGTGYQGFLIHADPHVTLEEDLLRRDLTINAIAKTDNNQFIDPYHGLEDIQARKLRHVSHAFSEDPLRILRVARFYAKLFHLGFDLVPETLALMKCISASGELTTLSTERIWHETKKALLTKTPTRYFHLLFQCGALSTLLPKLTENYQLDRPSTASLALEVAVEQNASLAIRLGCILIPESILSEHKMDGQSAECMSTRLSLPKKYRELLIGLYRTIYFLNTSTVLETQPCLTILLALDIARKPERFADILMIIKIIFQVKKQSLQPIDHLQQAWKALNALDIGVLVKQSNSTGAALVKQIRQAQLNVIQAFIMNLSL